MHSKNNSKKISNCDKDFWDSLHTEILLSNQKVSQVDMRALIEQSFIFSLFFRGCSQEEIIGFRSLLRLKEYGYVMLLDFETSTRFQKNFNTMSLHHYIRGILKDTNHIIGPLISNRISILVTLSVDNVANDLQNDKHENSLTIHEKESLSIADSLIENFNRQSHIAVSIGIGGITSFPSLTSSYIEALYALQFSNKNHRVHAKEMEGSKTSFQFDYYETEKRMLDAIRTGKSEAHDYFGLLMNWIQPFNDRAKRNHILELLTVAAHAKKFDKSSEMKYYNYVGSAKELFEYSGAELIEWAYRQFVHITGFEKPQNTIDYSNKVVQITKEYLEKHYTEDISLEDVASQVNISPQYFSKLIKKNTGFNFIDWLSMMRVRKAKELLNNSNLTVKEVCYMVGYKDPNYFSRIFKKRVGITPSEYIKNSKKSKNKA